MDWVDDELENVNLGDKRLNQRVRQVLKKLSQSPSESIATACGGWKETKAAYRLFDHPEISPSKILEPHQLATLERMRACETVLLLQDTTTLVFSTQKERKDIGPIHTEATRGLMLHPVLAVTPDRLCLGVLSCQQWHREKLLKKSPRERKKELFEKPIEEKESYRWLLGYRLANEYAEALPLSKIVTISDREGDIYDIYKEAQQETKKAYWLSRLCHNRAEVDEEGKGRGEKIREATKKTDPLGFIELILPNSHSRKGRAVRQAIYVKKVLFGLPGKRQRSEHDEPIEATVIVASEVNPPEGVEPIEWTLLTNLEVATYEEACEKIQWYTCRWEIELYFKVLKSGCRIEKLQLSENNFDLCLRLYMIIAWRILYLTMLGRACPELPCDCVFSREEWETIVVLAKKERPPKKAPSLDTMVRLLASLGGYLNRQSDSAPGIKTFWIGLRNLQEGLKAREAFSLVYGHTYG